MSSISSIFLDHHGSPWVQLFQLHMDIRYFGRRWICLNIEWPIFFGNMFNLFIIIHHFFPINRHVEASPHTCMCHFWLVQSCWSPHFRSALWHPSGAWVTLPVSCHSRHYKDIAQPDANEKVYDEITKISAALKQLKVGTVTSVIQHWMTSSIGSFPSLGPASGND